MNNKDRQVLKDSALVVADQIASSIPALNIAWGLSKALFGAGMKLRQQKALEWVEMVRDNPEVFTKELLEQEEFQDGFVYVLEKYLVERNENKREMARNIFLGFVQANNLENFPLERLCIALEQLSLRDIEVLKDVDTERNDRNYQIYGSTDKNVDNIFNLIHVGILRLDTSARFASEGYNAPFITITNFGKEFVKYIKDE